MCFHSAGTEDDDVREHLLNIPEPEHLKREFSSKDSLKRRSGAKISIVNLERFSDSGAPLLSGVTMNVQSGQVVGIIGPSGSGKSTLLRSLNRLWEPPADSVFLDGVDITKINVLTARRRVGMLFQTPQLFDGTLHFQTLPLHFRTFLQTKENYTKRVILFDMDFTQNPVDHEAVIIRTSCRF